MISLKPTAAEDLAFVLAAENHADNAPYVSQWSQERHLQAIAAPDEAHFVVLQGQGSYLGYLILQGLTDPNRVIQLRRLVITEKGQGYGRRVLAQVQRLAFLTYGAHRLWLDVQSNNPRAQALYARMGFTHEGCLRECLRGDQGYLSLHVMSMLQREYGVETVQ